MVNGTGAKDDAITTVMFKPVDENSSLIPPRKSCNPIFITAAVNNQKIYDLFLNEHLSERARVSSLPLVESFPESSFSLRRKNGISILKESGRKIRATILIFIPRLINTGIRA
jgi:hypothetical protein